MPTCIETPGAVLAMDSLFFGDKNPDGTADSNAWKQYGFNVDGLTSTEASVDVCKPNSGGSPAKAYPDGNSGIDNSFGKNVVPVFLNVDKEFTTNASQDIKDGKFTIMFRMDKLDPAADVPPFLTKLYIGADLGAAPAFDGSDCWPVIQSSLTDVKDIDTAKIALDGSAVTGNQWSSGAPTTIVLTVPVAGGALNLTIHKARITMDLDADHKGAINGHIGGVLDTEDFVLQIKKVAGTVNPVLCSGAIIDSIVTQIRQASDIMKDGKQDPGATCDGISIGLGFQAKAIVLGGVAPASPPEEDPCAM